jgi:hypothetical protein
VQSITLTWLLDRVLCGRPLPVSTALSDEALWLVMARFRPDGLRPGGHAHSPGEPSRHTGPKRNGDLSIVFQSRDANVFDLRATGSTEGGRQLVTRHQFATHDILIHHTIVNQCAGSPLDPDFQLSSFLLLKVMIATA